jgi:hypothetical protein
MLKETFYVGAKKAPLVAEGLLWKPFDARFEEILGDFRFHADVVKTELLLTHLYETASGKSTIVGQIQELNKQMKEAEKARVDRDEKGQQSEQNHSTYWRSSRKVRKHLEMMS